MADVPPAVTPEPVIRMMQGVIVTGIVQAAIELRVFDQIAQGATDARAVARAAGADPRGTQILLDALAALGLLDTANGGYALSPLARFYLLSSSPASLSGMMDIVTGGDFWEAYRRLADAVRRGGAVLEKPGETPEHGYWESFAPASVSMAAPAAAALADRLYEWVSGRETLNILDVACGGGLMSLTLAARHPQAHVTLLDWENVLPAAKRTAESFGLADRVRLLPGDAFEVPLDGPYDLIVLSHFLHHFAEERCLAVLRRLSATLKPGGKLAINEFAAVTDSPTDEPWPRLFAVVMLAWTREGDAYPVATYERWLEEAGFSKPEVHSGGSLPGVLMLAERI